MRKAGRPVQYVMSVWTGIALIMGPTAVVGYALVGDLPPAIVAVIGAFAAGGLLALVAETMIPDAFDQAPEFIGLITVARFLVAFGLAKLG
jgi:ZIP family zinc transporter